MLSGRQQELLYALEEFSGETRTGEDEKKQHQLLFVVLPVGYFNKSAVVAEWLVRCRPEKELPAITVFTLVASEAKELLIQTKGALDTVEPRRSAVRVDMRQLLEYTETPVLRFEALGNKSLRGLGRSLPVYFHSLLFSQLSDENFAGITAEGTRSVWFVRDDDVPTVNERCRGLEKHGAGVKMVYVPPTERVISFDLLGQ
jgi:hypothetical protein